jgi:hypothetical protein
MDILPKLADKTPIYAYNFEANRIPGEPEDSVPYWRDVGTIEAYYEANMDLNHVKPELNLYNREWPVRSTSYPDPPAKFVFDEEKRRGGALDSSTASFLAAAFFPADSSASLFSAVACASTPARWWKVASSWTTATLGATPKCAAPSSIRMYVFQKEPRSATISMPTALADGT